VVHSANSSSHLTSELHTSVSPIGQPDSGEVLDDAPDIILRFDKTTELRFRDPEEPQYIKFASLKDRSARWNSIWSDSTEWVRADGLCTSLPLLIKLLGFVN
jgi:hypothetical protein